MNTALRVAFAASVLVSIALGCEFRYDPASVPRFYREEGWGLPGIHDDDPHVKPNGYGAPPVGDLLRAVPGAKMYLLRRDEDHYVINFPAQLFALGDEHKKMRPFLAKATIIRWEINGKVLAYSYGLIPISKAYKQDGKWVYEGELGCIFYGTFIDDKGDGVFRTLVPDTLRPELIPAWAKAPTT
jgi:hypothetical protein